MKAISIKNYLPSGAILISIASLSMSYLSWQQSEENLVKTRRLSISQTKIEIFHINAKSEAALEEISTKAEALRDQLNRKAEDKPALLKDPKVIELKQTLEDLTKLSANQAAKSKAIEERLSLVGESDKAELELIGLLGEVKKINAMSEGKAWMVNLTEYENTINSL